jgi:hypothetical protein
MQAFQPRQTFLYQRFANAFALVFRQHRNWAKPVP